MAARARSIVTPVESSDVVARAVEPGEGVALVLTTCPDQATAMRIARTLVEERLAACGNVLPGLSSIYRWQEAVEMAEECLLLLKTRREGVDRLARRLAEIHPYEVPEVLALPVDRGAPEYLRWVVEQTEPRS